MGLTEDEREIIVNLELEKAQKTFSDMEYCIQGEKWESAANRLYYAMFHAMSALLISDGHNVKSHRGVIEKLQPYVAPARQLISKIKEYISAKK